LDPQRVFISYPVDGVIAICHIPNVGIRVAVNTIGNVIVSMVVWDIIVARMATETGSSVAGTGCIHNG